MHHNIECFLFPEPSAWRMPFLGLAVCFHVLIFLRKELYIHLDIVSLFILMFFFKQQTWFFRKDFTQQIQKISSFWRKTNFKVFPWKKAWPASWHVLVQQSDGARRSLSRVEGTWRLEPKDLVEDHRVHHKNRMLHEKINPKDWQVLSLGDVGFLQFFRVVLSDYGKPRISVSEWWLFEEFM